MRCWIFRALSYRIPRAVDENKHHGALFRFNVFHRDGEICERCGGDYRENDARVATVLLVSGVPALAIRYSLFKLSCLSFVPGAFTGRFDQSGSGVAVV